MLNSELELLYTVKSNEVFWYGQEDYRSEEVNWITVYIPKNKFSLECCALDNLQGFIHKSKIKPFNPVSQYKAQTLLLSILQNHFLKKIKL